jgi:phytoene dehydrogenase-like protein
MDHITIVGGGIGGLVAAIAAREQGLGVTLHEAHHRLGGRGWTTEGDYKANWGCHVVYTDGPMWRWLDERGLGRPANRFPTMARPAFREDGAGHRAPSIGASKAFVKLRRRAADAPIDRSFREWSHEVVGDAVAADKVAAFMGVATFHHDPGSLSAAFVAERLRRASSFPPSVRYVVGGWGSLIDRMANRARELGAELLTSSPVDTLPSGSVVLAVPLRVASKLLGEPISWTGTRTALLDVAVDHRRGDAFIVGDFDQSGWAEAFSMPDPSLAPDGQHLVQAQVGMRPGEDLATAIERAEGLLDAGYRDWAERVRWRRQAKIEDETGAVDLPGTSWRDRPVLDRGDDVHLVGDMVAAPGLLAEVAHASALAAVDALAARRRTTAIA